MGCGASVEDNVTYDNSQHKGYQQQLHSNPKPQNQQDYYHQHVTNPHQGYQQQLHSNPQPQNQQDYNYNQHVTNQDQGYQHSNLPPQNQQDYYNQHLNEQHQGHDQNRNHNQSPQTRQQPQPQNSAESMEETVAASRAILDSETEEEMRVRLSRYGEFASSYTIKEIIEVNGDRDMKGGVTLFRYHKKVVCAEALKDLVRPEIKKLEHDYLQKHPEEASTFQPDDFHWCTPILRLLNHGMKSSLIKRYVGKCTVADLAGTEQEYWEDIKQDVQTIIGETENPYEIIFSEQYLQELKEVYQRFLDKYTQTSGMNRNEEPRSGDPNAAPFPLEVPYSENPELLRAWVETWAKFDTEVEEKEWEPWCFKEKLEDIPKPEEVLIRKDWDSLPDLNHEIDGEAAWDVIEVDLFKNDVTTPEQDKVWAQRESRTDLYNPESMEKRRKAIEQYFIDKYEWPASKLDPYRGFCERMQESWARFQELCEKE